MILILIKLIFLFFQIIYEGNRVKNDDDEDDEFKDEFWYKRQCQVTPFHVRSGRSMRRKMECRSPVSEGISEGI